MGIFSFFKSKPKPPVFANESEEFLYKVNPKYYWERKKFEEDLAYQNELLSKVNAAREKYKKDGDLSAVIQVYEFAFIESDPPCKSSQCFLLLDFYLKADLNDKAWSYLNKLLTEEKPHFEKIRMYQARLLKKEKRWKDAIQMYMLEYLAKSEWKKTFDKEMFIKDIRSSINKLNWSVEDIISLSNLVEKQVKKKDYSEEKLIKSYRKFLSEKSDVVS